METMVDVCKCEGTRTIKSGLGWKLDVDRNMWVCGGCSKPGQFHRGTAEYCYTRMCLECCEYYTTKQMPDNDMLCPECLGE